MVFSFARYNGEVGDVVVGRVIEVCMIASHCVHSEDGMIVGSAL